MSRLVLRVARRPRQCRPGRNRCGGGTEHDQVGWPGSIIVSGIGTTCHQLALKTAADYNGTLFTHDLGASMAFLILTVLLTADY